MLHHLSLFYAIFFPLAHSPHLRCLEMKSGHKLSDQSKLSREAVGNADASGREGREKKVKNNRD